MTTNPDVKLPSKVKFSSSSLCDFPCTEPRAYGFPEMDLDALHFPALLFSMFFPYLAPLMVPRGVSGSCRRFWCPAVCRGRMKTKRPSAFWSFGHLSNGKHPSVLANLKRKAWDLEWVGDATFASVRYWMCDQPPGHMVTTFCNSQYLTWIFTQLETLILLTLSIQENKEEDHLTDALFNYSNVE